MKKIKLIVGGILVLVAVFFYLSFRLVQDPDGLTIDEASIGYNAILISKTLRDETGRLLPIFPLTINKTNWKQPSSVYASAVMFKLFGASLYNLRLVSVLTALFSFCLVVYLNYLLLGKKGVLVSGLLFLSSPIVLMHSHLAQENIMPLPFVTAWLIFILLSEKKRDLRFLILSGFFLGVGIYSYKGMRALVPVLGIVTAIYLFIYKKSLKGVSFFVLGMLPFVLPIPWINSHYSGALFDNTNLHLLRFNEFFYPYLSSFDLTGLFVKGDITPWHSTGIHGVFLLCTLPLFLIGMVSAIQQKHDKLFWRFLFFGFILAPLLYGQAGSLYRFSRLLIFVPFVISFCTLGLVKLLDIKGGKIFTCVLSILLVFNFYDFIHFYWYDYPKATSDVFYENTENYYKHLSELSRKYNLSPYVYTDDYLSIKENSQFFEAAYFTKKIGQWKPGDSFPKNGILMTRLESQPDMMQIEPNNWHYHYLINKN